MKTPSIVVVIVVAVVVILAVVFFMPAKVEHENLREKLRETQDQVDALTHELTEVQAELKKLREKDPAVIEKIARDKFGLAREGETIYKFPREDEAKKRDE